MGNETSKGHWQRDEDCVSCHKCAQKFSVSNRRHHCRNCGYVFCGRCSSRSRPIPTRNIVVPARVCDECFHTLAANEPSHAHSASVERSRKSAESRGSASASVNGFPPQSTTGVEADVPRRLSSADSSVEQVARGEGIDKSAPWLAAIGNSASAIAVDVPADGTGARASSTVVYYDERGQTQHSAPGAYGGCIRGCGKTNDELERERLVQCWNDIRGRALFMDILVQRVERVDPSVTMEYSSETSQVTLSPEVPEEQIGSAIGFPPSVAGGAATAAVNTAVSLLLTPQEEGVSSRQSAPIDVSSRRLMETIAALSDPSPLTRAPIAVFR